MLVLLTSRVCPTSVRVYPAIIQLKKNDNQLFRPSGPRSKASPTLSNRSKSNKKSWLAAYARTFTLFFTVQVFLKQNKELKSDARIISEYSNLSAVTLVVGFADSLCVDFQTIGGLEQGNSAGAVVRETRVIERAENVFSGRHAGHAVQLHSRGFVHFSLCCEKVRVWV